MREGSMKEKRIVDKPNSLAAVALAFILGACVVDDVENDNDDTGEVTAPTDDVPYDGVCDDWWEEVAEYTCRSNIICDNGCWCTILHSCFDGNEGGDYIYEKECGCEEL